MFNYRHVAFNLATGEIVNSNHGHNLKRSVAFAERRNREWHNVYGQWRWCHDFGKRWDKQGFPTC